MTRTEITKIINWYSSIPEDFNDIDTLLYQSKELSCLAFSYAVEVGKTKYDLERAYYKRKLGIARAGQTKEGTQAERERNAVIICEDLIETEQEASAIYSASRLILDQTNKVLESMRQQISYLKREKDVISSSN